MLKIPSVKGCGCFVQQPLTPTDAEQTSTETAWFGPVHPHTSGAQPFPGTMLLAAVTPLGVKVISRHSMPSKIRYGVRNADCIYLSSEQGTVASMSTLANCDYVKTRYSRLFNSHVNTRHSAEGYAGKILLCKSDSVRYGHGAKRETDFLQ